MLTPRQAFKVGFLRQCANQGLTSEETHARVKQAVALVKSGDWSDVFTRPVNTAWDVAGSTAKGLGNIGLSAMLLGPPALGAAAGAAYTKMTDADQSDVDEVKKRELIAEYRRQVEKIRKRKKSYRLP